MIATHAFVLAAATAPVGGVQGFLVSAGPMLPMVAILFLGYFMIWRPQQRAAKERAAKISAVKRGDTVVLNSGMIGKVVRVEDGEIGVEIAQNVTVKVVKTMIGEIRTRGEPAPANDAKS